MAEEETGNKDGDIGKKSEEERKKKMKGRLMLMLQELLTKVVQINMKGLDINLI
jgi:hypothetical protein